MFGGGKQDTFLYDLLFPDWFCLILRRSSVSDSYTLFASCFTCYTKGLCLLLFVCLLCYLAI